MPSTRKQKAKEKRSRQSYVMSDIENLDVMLGNYQESDQVRDQNLSNADFDSESRRPQRESNLISGNFRSALNTNTSENSEITAETSRAINSEVSPQMSRKLAKNEIRFEFSYIRGYKLCTRGGGDSQHQKCDWKPKSSWNREFGPSVRWTASVYF